MFSTLELVLFMLLSSSKMDSLLERSLLLSDKSLIILCADSLLSLVVGLSSKLVLFSKESCLEISFSIMRSTLQKKKNTFSFGYDILMKMYSLCFLYFLGVTFSFFLELPGLLARAACGYENNQDPKGRFA